jgi:hypothetical protein
MTNLQRTVQIRLISLGQQPADVGLWIREQRGAEDDPARSWQSIARQLLDLTGVLVTDRTVRRWCAAERVNA